MKTIVKTLFGSRLYGTNTPESDTDYKGVHLPDPIEMLLHKKVDHIKENTKEDRTAKNTSDDVDYESNALHRFFKLLEGSDSMAVEMLFTPETHILEVTPEWRTVLGYRDRFITKNIDGDLGYMHRQANKYGVKGSRMATVKLAISWVESWIRLYGSISGLGQHYKAISDFADANEHSSVVGIPHPSGVTQWHWEVCDRKLPFGNSLGQTHAVLTRIFENYGERTRAAEENEGIDWKALSHAIRVGNQAIERLQTGELTFPRPDADFLRKVKQGEVHYKKVSQRLEEIMDSMRFAQGKSSLPDEIDIELTHQITLQFYSNQIFQTDPRKLGWAPASSDSLLGEAAFALVA
ncbi:nucleotidyltransferase domain-containing protein [Methylobacterium sp. WL120]|uniref:DNA polymerase beta superfamily protein n=1 Tax=Methylobacterium sp. WL120 TaxID=2603887 RepID=UPI0011C7CE0E|nr:nucleotidyltransferase domain-containing protein [Methylobacterium sp. WL120]TXM68316.1 hypothetical protein FV229_08070 [Methylobacterium sp. WL120]